MIQAEVEELGTKIESLTEQNLSLKSEINRLTVHSANLELQNAKLLVLVKFHNLCYLKKFADGND